MAGYEHLYKLLDKKTISLEILREITDNEHVKSVEYKKSDKILYNKYDVVLDNGELYYAYVKKSIPELLKIFSAHKA